MEKQRHSKWYTNNICFFGCCCVVFCFVYLLFILLLEMEIWDKEKCCEEMQCNLFCCGLYHFLFTLVSFYSRLHTTVPQKFIQQDFGLDFEKQASLFMKAVARLCEFENTSKANFLILFLYILKKLRSYGLQSWYGHLLTYVQRWEQKFVSINTTT